MNKFLILVALTQITACSNRAVYENMQQHQRIQCLDELPSVYQECIERTKKSYEEYRRERQEVVKE
ncbi:hypothetical protein [Neptunicella sp.]|uniref:hypothetical protein n=1 Tax=Neptunicella sp. TaxID=2125986 RepID=UPI003F694970